MSVGLRIFKERRMPSSKLVEAFSKLPTANICDCMERLGVMNSDIKLISNPAQTNFAGAALTVRAKAGDNLLLHAEIDLAGPGDVIIVDNEGERNRSLAGAIMFGYCMFKGIEGLIIDGPIRDLEEAREMDWHLYATGATSRGPYKLGPGEVNVPICCGGVTVHPGDIIVGDLDGILVIPLEDAERILEKAVPFAAKDAEKSAAAPFGKLDRSWVSRQLTAAKVEIIDGHCPR